MNYYRDIVEEYDDIEERYELVMERIRQIPEEAIVLPQYREYFKTVASYLLFLDEILDCVKNDRIHLLEETKLQKWNEALYQDVVPGKYENSFCSAEYLYKRLSEATQNTEDMAKMLSFLYYEIKGLAACAFEGRIVDITLYCELFVEIYLMFVEKECVKAVRDVIYSFMNDYAEFFITYRTREKLDPVLSFATDIIMEADLSNTAYLYQYGEYISENEIKTSRFLNTLDTDTIVSIAKAYTEGYRLGFEAARIDLSKKKTVNIRFAIGQERIIREAIKQFRDMGLEPVCHRSDIYRINRRLMYKVGYTSTTVNKQMEYDHRMDDAIFLDKKLIERKLEVLNQAYSKYAHEAAVYAGPACMEVFGEIPFTPKNNPFVPVQTKKQQDMVVKYQTESTQIFNRYIPGDERSFTIIAFPCPEIGADFEEIFRETVKINSLDNDTFRKIHQSIIDELDKAEYVRVVGRNGNKTDMKVCMHVLEHPEKETNFENCVADVNIPVGEVFTSPKLTGTEGILNVSRVYLDDLKYTNLSLTFKDGMITDYTCDNFETEEENKNFIRENLLMGRDTLPIGEFAIGTNTTAYVIANKYDIVYKLPILIVEKMGPHFAVGDTCYSWSEENKLYNPDGKEIVAKENECSVLRKTDIEKAYFNCHTDITIPYDEIGRIYTVHADKTEVDIIVDGRFVIAGTEKLNEPFEESEI